MKLNLTQIRQSGIDLAYWSPCLPATLITLLHSILETHLAACFEFTRNMDCPDWEAELFDKAVTPPEQPRLYRRLVNLCVQTTRCKRFALLTGQQAAARSQARRNVEDFNKAIEASQYSRPPVWALCLELAMCTWTVFELLSGLKSSTIHTSFIKRTQRSVSGQPSEQAHQSQSQSQSPKRFSTGIAVASRCMSCITCVRV